MVETDFISLNWMIKADARRLVRFVATGCSVSVCRSNDDVEQRTRMDGRTSGPAGCCRPAGATRKKSPEKVGWDATTAASYHEYLTKPRLLSIPPLSSTSVCKMLRLLQVLITSIIIERSDAFITSSRVEQVIIIRRLPQARAISPPVLRMIETINLEPLGDDHEAEGTRIAKSIAGWLDMEWCPQEVHRAIGENVKKTYVRARQGGDDCVSSLMHEVAESLQSNWAEYDKDAFVNAYDVANYFSDYCSIRAGVEECNCHSQIFDPDV